MAIPRSIQNLGEVFSGLSKREQLLLGCAAAVFALFVALLLTISIRSSLADRESRVELKKQGLLQVSTLSAGFRDAEAARRSLEARLRGAPKRSLVSTMEEMAKSQGIAIAKMTPKRPITKGSLTENAVDVSFEPTSIDKVAGLVNGLQKAAGIIKISKLRLRKKFGEAEKLDVSFTVSNYNLEVQG